jgi:hypothetical protein
MQSDERVAAALSALRPRVAAFRFAVSGAAERASSTIAAESGPTQARNALGDFGGRLIDPDRFAMVSSGAGPLDAFARDAVARAADLLGTLLRAGDEEFVVDVGSGSSLSEAVRGRLAKLGSVFSTATLIEQVRRRTYDPAQQEGSSVEYPFELWSASERRFAPPLVVRVDGSDLDPFALAPLIDGWVRFILLVNEPSAPAPLARLISPGAFVAQSDDLNVLQRVADFDGPAVIAVMSGTGARFVHDPRAGSATWQRIEATHLPEAQPRRSLSIRSAWQQRDDLAHLKALAERPMLPATTPEALLAGVGAGSSDPAERLTAWLLDQSNPDGIA